MLTSFHCISAMWLVSSSLSVEVQLGLLLPINWLQLQLHIFLEKWGFIEKHHNVWWKSDNRMTFQVHLV